MARQIRFSGKSVFSNLPSPSQEEMDSPEFNALWDIIKHWDIMTPDSGGYSGGNGSHVKLLLDALKPVIRDRKIDELLND